MNKTGIPTAAGFLALLVATLVMPPMASAQTGDLDAKIADLFENRCARAGCHAGPVPQLGMELTRERFYGAIVDEPSVERPELKRVDPGNPKLSYLMMKLQGDPGIIGTPMPLVGDELTQAEIDLVRDWITSIDTVDQARKQTTVLADRYPFYGWKIVNLPTTRTVDRNSFLFMISHRFNPKISDGYDAFYGIDGSGIIFIGLGYAFTDKLVAMLGRSNSDDNVEMWARYRLFEQSPDGGWPAGSGKPFSASVRTALNWVTAKPPGVNDRVRSEAFKFNAQLTLAREIGDFGVAVVPGVLFNPAEAVDGEDALITIGLGGRYRLSRNLAVVGEWVPIAGGYIRTSTFGNDIRFDSWGGGLEIRTSGHVFQIVVSNTVGLTTDQYMRGGDLDPEEGDMRLGFNIFRVLNFW
jgi:hypothetical protein